MRITASNERCGGASLGRVCLCLIQISLPGVSVFFAVTVLSYTLLQHLWFPEVCVNLLL